MKPLSLLKICLLFLFMVSCSLAEPEPSATSIHPVNTQIPPTATPRPTNTPPPQPTATPQPTNTPTPQPTNTPTPQPTSTMTPTPELVASARFVVMDPSKFELWLELLIIPPNGSVDLEFVNEILLGGVLQWTEPDGASYLAFAQPRPLERSGIMENFSDELSGPTIRLDLLEVMGSSETGTYKIVWALPEGGSITIGESSPVLLDTGVVEFTWDNQELVIIE